METLTVSIAVPERHVFQGPAESVVLPGASGSLGVLPGHAPLLTTLRAGPLLVRAQGRELRFQVLGGFAEITPSLVHVLADGVREDAAA